MYIDYDIVDMAADSISTILDAIHGRRVVIWSANIRGKDVYLALRKLGLQAAFFVDRNFSRIPECCGLPVKAPDTVNPASDYVVVAANLYFPEIEEALRDKGFAEKADYLYIDKDLLYMREDHLYRGCSIGRYTYGYQDFLSALIPNDVSGISIGRFCSINETARLVTNHPMGYISTAQYLYNSPFIPSEYREAYNQSLREVADFEEDGSPDWDFAEHPDFVLKMGNDVWVGSNVRIMGGVEIGDGAIIGAGAVVTHDVPSYTIVGGVPARKIRTRFSEEMVEQLLSIRWWDWEPEKIFSNIGIMRYPEKFIEKFGNAD